MQPVDNADKRKDTPSSRSQALASELIYEESQHSGWVIRSDVHRRVAVALDAARAEERERVLAETPETIAVMRDAWLAACQRDAGAEGCCKAMLAAIRESGE